MRGEAFTGKPVVVLATVSRNGLSWSSRERLASGNCGVATPEVFEEALVAEWIAKGAPPQDGIGWRAKQWLPAPAKYPRVAALADLIRTLPNPVRRTDVAVLGSRAAKSPKEAVQAFVASMVWGFGDTGYGAFRVNRILASDPYAAGKLYKVAQVLADAGPVEGYQVMANEQRLKWLGPAFGTKYLHFCSSADDPALVLDDLVASAVSGNVCAFDECA